LGQAFELLGYDGREWVALECRRGPVEQDRERDAFDRRCDHVAETDIDLERDAGALERRHQLDSDATVALAVSRITSEVTLLASKVKPSGATGSSPISANTRTRSSGVVAAEAQEVEILGRADGVRQRGRGAVGAPLNTKRPRVGEIERR
jgi:hypothetical protein